MLALFRPYSLFRRFRTPYTDPAEATEPEEGAWILTTGAWNDSQEWDDHDTWRDA